LAPSWCRALTFISGSADNVDPKTNLDAAVFRIGNQHYEADGTIVYQHACRLGCEGIVSKRLGSPYRSGRTSHWLKVKNPNAPAVTREAEEDWS
jgi:ATP-dependent DNA ligase